MTDKNETGKSGASNNDAKGGSRAAGDDPKEPRATTAVRPRGDSWMSTHGRDLKFIIIFGSLMALYYAATTTETLNGQFFPWYLNTTAEAGGDVLHAFGYDNVRVVGTAMDTDDGSPGTITVDRGCDAIAPTALFISAVIASPASWVAKLLGVVAGTLILMAINLLRIISLFLTAVHWPRVFDVMHLDIWQAAFIFLAILLWGVWASWAARRKKGRSIATA